jgi:hypothetical protein
MMRPRNCTLRTNCSYLTATNVHHASENARKVRKEFAFGHKKSSFERCLLCPGPDLLAIDPCKHRNRETREGCAIAHLSLQLRRIKQKPPALGRRRLEKLMIQTKNMLVEAATDQPSVGRRPNFVALSCHSACSRLLSLAMGDSEPVRKLCFSASISSLVSCIASRS